MSLYSLLNTESGSVDRAVDRLASLRSPLNTESGSIDWSGDRLASPYSLINLREWVGQPSSWPTLHNMHILACRSIGQLTILMLHWFFYSIHVQSPIFLQQELKTLSSRFWSSLYNSPPWWGFHKFDPNIKESIAAWDRNTISTTRSIYDLWDWHTVSAARSTYDLHLADQSTTIDSSNELYHYDCLHNPCLGDQASRSSSKWAPLSSSS